MEISVTPGQRLGNVDEVVAGNGTYVRNMFVHASVLGTKIIQEVEDKKNINISIK